MAKKQIDFTGPSVYDLGIETENGNSKKANTKNGALPVFASVVDENKKT
jgi:hypothetical protein